MIQNPATYIPEVTSGTLNQDESIGYGFFSMQMLTNLVGGLLAYHLCIVGILLVYHWHIVVVLLAYC